MKLRIRGNSVRLRLGQSEVRRLAEQGEIEESTQFNAIGNQRLMYGLKAAVDATSVTADFTDGRLLVRLPIDIVSHWASSDEVGIEVLQPLDSGNSLRILIEKDFECIDGRMDEPQDDAFPHPDQSACKLPEKERQLSLSPLLSISAGEGMAVPGSQATDASVADRQSSVVPCTQEVEVRRVTGVEGQLDQDLLAIEEPLEIRLAYHHGGALQEKSISITMRTPGHDLELAAGFFLSEGIVSCASDFFSLRHCGPAVGEPKLQNVVRVELRPDTPVDIERLTRHFYTSSSCGVCGKASIAALEVTGMAQLRAITAGRPTLLINTLHQLPSRLREAQDIFDRTGGLHAAALFDSSGTLVCLREDVGRHNAVDKVFGNQLLQGQLPLHDMVLLVSGRVSFELVQKALLAKVQIIAAVGAPSSLAVGLAKQYGMTLVGFLRNGHFNIYCGGERITAM